jgi:hypothetical protein
LNESIQPESFRRADKGDLRGEVEVREMGKSGRMHVAPDLQEP